MAITVITLIPVVRPAESVWAAVLSDGMMLRFMTTTAIGDLIVSYKVDFINNTERLKLRLRLV